MKSLLIVIPAFNEEKTIKDVINALPKQIEGLDSISCLVVDDGSSDNTRQYAMEAGAVVISHEKNYGVGKALQSGIDYCLENKFSFLVNIDADGQFDPNEIKDLIKPIVDSRCDFVAGNRFKEGRPSNMPISKYYGNHLMTWLISFLAKGKFSDVSCGFRAYNREALLNMNLFGDFTYTQESFLDLSFKNVRIDQVPISVKYFKDRKSKVANNLLSYAFKTMKIIVRSIVYYRPLWIFGWTSLVSMLIGAGFIIFLLYHKISVGTYSPYKAYGFIGTGFVLFSAILLLLGILSDVVDKLRRTQERILYLTKKSLYKKNGE